MVSSIANHEIKENLTIWKPILMIRGKSIIEFYPPTWSSSIDREFPGKNRTDNVRFRGKLILYQNMRFVYW